MGGGKNSENLHYFIFFKHFIKFVCVFLLLLFLVFCFSFCFVFLFFFILSLCLLSFILQASFSKVNHSALVTYFKLLGGLIIGILIFGAVWTDL